MKNSIFALVLVILFIFGAAFSYIQDCGGVERWDVKTATDFSAAKIDTVARKATVSAMTKLKVPVLKIKSNTPRSGKEFFTYSVTGFIKYYKMEADSDIHVVLQDLKDSTKTIIAEFPNMNCERASKSIFAKKMTNARNQFKTFIKRVHYVVPGVYTLTGVAFFDKVHGQIGVAPNGVELHPVFSIVKIK